MRVQSPSSINTYNQCPRKYFYQYILKLPTSPSIHTARGSAVHESLEDFYDLSIPAVLPRTELRTFLELYLLNLLKEKWNQKKDIFSKLPMTREELMSYYQETQLMLIQWISTFLQKIDSHMSEGKSFEEAFALQKP